MNAVRWARRILARGLAVLVAVTALLASFAAVYVAAGILGALIPGPVGRSASPGDLSRGDNFGGTGGGGSTRIALLGGPLHYDIVLPLTPGIRTGFAFAESGGVPVFYDGAEWLIVGWGAEGFYTTTHWADRRIVPVVWRAITGDASVIRLETGGPVTDPRGIVWIDLDERRLEALAAAILGSFARDARDEAIPLDYEGYSGTDAFFRAKGRFDIFRTCNAWVGRTLRRAGIPFGVWTPMPVSVRLSASWQGLAAGR